ncbi:MAG: rhodanese-like domain-containing protein [Steroidobacteraceae bacterium]|nr:rhodanese-like domain-containing protein [Steroidobacteraceae bacterium]
MNRRTMLLANLLFAAACAMPAGAAEPAQPAERAPLISQAELLAKLDQKQPGVVVLDVRTATEFAAGHVPGARNVSHDELPTRLEELAALRDTPVVLYCRSGRRTQLAEDVLRKAGFTKLLHLEGDWLAWEAAKRPVESR